MHGSPKPCTLEIVGMRTQMLDEMIDSQKVREECRLESQKRFQAARKGEAGRDEGAGCRATGGGWSTRW